MVTFGLCVRRVLLLTAAVFAVGGWAAPRVVLVTAEAEYWTWQTLPALLDANLAAEWKQVSAEPDDRDRLARGWEAIREADLLVLSVRRRALPTAQLAAIRAHLAAGKPVVAIRTTSHGFALRKGEPKAGHEVWPEFDAEVLGGSYSGHGPSSAGTVVTKQSSHPIVGKDHKRFKVRSWLYHAGPVAKDVEVLQSGVSEAGGDAHPVSWVRTLPSGSRVFYTSLGHPEDFQEPAVPMMLRNAMHWCLEEPIPKGPAKYRPWGDYWEADQPVIGATVDARGWTPDNLTVRGEIIRVGPKIYACYDVDMVRLAAVWHGDGLSADSMSAFSYAWENRGRKVSPGQKKLPKPLGKAVTSLGLVPGVGTGELPIADPRPPAPDRGEVGRGPIAESLGKWLGRYETETGPVVAYEVAGTRVLERLVPWSSDDGIGYLRHFTVAARTKALRIRLAGYLQDAASKQELIRFAPGAGGAKLQSDRGGHILELPPGPEQHFVVGVWRGPEDGRGPKQVAATPIKLTPGTRRWPDAVETRSRRSTTINGGYVMDEIPLPTPNDMDRNVRLGGIGFFDDGRAAVSTFDGDVWLVSGLDKGLREVRWQRFAAGLFEPLNLTIADGKVMVFTRNGLIRLHDRNNDGEADFYETFCHLFSQSAETREFAMSLVRHPDGSFYVSKGAQSKTHQSLLPGTVLRIASDGNSYEVVATGLREPFLGVHPRTGTVVASDQQGHWVPSTPVHLIEKGGWYGFYSNLQKPTDRQPNKPLIWQPHRLQASGVGMVWADDKRFGPLSGKLLGFDYFSGKILVMDWQDDQRVTGAWQLAGTFDNGPLHAAVNPQDGQVYVAGFGLWGSARPTLSGLTRIRYAGGASVVPTRVEPFREGLMIRLATAMDARSALRRENYAVARWNYKRSNKYGSGHFRPDTGKAGEQNVGVESVTLSTDGKGIFLRLESVPQVDQLKVDFSLKDGGGGTHDFAVWTTPRQVAAFVPAAHGFPPLRPAEAAVAAAAGGGEVSAALGKQVAAQFGCVACHSDDGTTAGKTGPSWKGIYGSPRVAVDGSKQKADDAYLRQAIIEPTAFVLKGYDKEGIGMPAYAGVLKPHQVDSLLAYIRSLK